MPGAFFSSGTFTYGVSFVPDTATPDPDVFATTQWINGKPTTNVTINMIGKFFDGSAIPALSDNDFRAFVLLHELGHMTGKDTGIDTSQEFNLKILDKCFGVHP